MLAFGRQGAFMPAIVLSYRRDDARGVAGRVFDRLVGEYGKDAVFMDVDTIPPGADFRHHLDHVLARCDILLAIIGPHWRGRHDSGYGRLGDDDDFVRFEIERALERNIRVIPVLIDDTPMPQPKQLPHAIAELASRQAVSVDSGVRFHTDMDRLIDSIGRRRDLKYETAAVISLLRRKFLSAPSTDELVRAKYELDAFLKSHPVDVEALILRDQIAHAIASELGPRGVDAHLIAPARRATRRAARTRWAVAAALLAVAILYFLVFPFFTEPPSIAGFALYSESSIEGAELNAGSSPISVANVSQCAQACRPIPACAAFSFHKLADANGRHSCALYRAPVRPLKNDSWTSGVRR
jgi:TIR domain